METESSNWDQLWFNIFRVCHCVQTLTQTLCPFRNSVTQASLDLLIVHLEAKAGHMYVHALARTQKHTSYTNIWKVGVSYLVLV